VVLVEINGERLVLVPLRQFCQHLGIDWPSQYQRVQRDEILAKEMMSVVLTTTLIPVRGQRQSYPTLCLPLDLLPGWLFTISPTRVKPELRERIQRYRGQCYRVLWKAFLQGELFSEEQERATVIEAVGEPSGIESIHALSEQINTLTAIVAFLQEHRRMLLEEAGQVITIVEAGQQELLGRADQLSAQLTYVSSLLEQLVGRQETTEAQIAQIDARTQRLTPAHARAVQGLVEKIVRESERHNPKGAALIHAQVYGRLKSHFRAGKFDEIPDERYLEVEALQAIALRTTRNVHSNSSIT
jgi:P22_AR N-terminal domain